VTPRWSERKGAFAEERERLSANSLGSQPKETAVFSGDTSCCPLPTSTTGRTGSNGQPGLKESGTRGCTHPPLLCPITKREHQLNPPPRHSAGVSHPHFPSPGWMMWGLAARDHWVSTGSGSVAVGISAWHGPSVPLPWKWHEPEPSLPPKTGGGRCSPLPPSSTPPFGQAAPRHINGQFLPVPQPTRSQGPAGQRDPSKATLIAGRLG